MVVIVIMSPLPNSALASACLFFAFAGDLPAIVLHCESSDRTQIERLDATPPLDQLLVAAHHDVPRFPYWEHVGMVGMGSGVYLGSGWVLTSAHVGCYPFKMGDGSYYPPHYPTWRILRNPDGSKSDVAIFRVKVDDPQSSLA